MRVLTILLLILGLHAEAQNLFNKRCDPYHSPVDNAWSLVVDSNFIRVAIGTYPGLGINPKLATVLAKLDFYGNILDTNIVSFPNANVYPGGPASLNFANYGYILGGSFEDSIGETDALLIRLLDSGDTLWTKRILGSGYQSGWMAKQDDDGGFLLCGQTNISQSPYNNNALLLKTDSLGNLLWQRNYGDTIGNELAFSFVKTLNGGYALSGQWRTGAENDIWIALIDSSGTKYWDSIIHNTIYYDDGAWNIINTSDGNLLVTGFYATEPQSPHPYFLKMDLQGNVIWKRQYRRANALERVFSSRELPDGSFISVGYHDSPPQGRPIVGFLMKLSAAGDSLWSQDYFNGIHSNHELRDVYPTPDGGFVACGWINPHFPDTGYQDLWIIKVDSMGCEVANCTVGITEMEAVLQPLNIYPVPFSSELNVSIKADYENGELRVFDLTGRVITEIKVGKGDFKLNSIQWQKGIYFVQLLTNKGSYSKKVIKTGY